MVVTTPVVTITDVQRNSSSVSESTNALASVWGSLYEITPGDSVIYDHMLILHSPDVGSDVWDTDTWTIEFTATDSGQAKGDWLITKSFNNHLIPTSTTTWTSTETMDFNSGDLDNGTGEFLQAVTGVAKLDDSEYESPGNDIFGVGLITITAMPTVTIGAGFPSSFVFADDEFTFDSGDSGETVSVSMTHDDLPTSGDYAELWDNAGTPVLVTTYTNNPFTTTLTDGYHLKLYIDIPADAGATDIAVRRINMTEN